MHISRQYFKNKNSLFTAQAAEMSRWPEQKKVLSCLVSFSTPILDLYNICYLGNQPVFIKVTACFIYSVLFLKVCGSCKKETRLVFHMGWAAQNETKWESYGYIVDICSKHSHFPLAKPVSHGYSVHCWSSHALNHCLALSRHAVSTWTYLTPGPRWRIFNSFMVNKYLLLSIPFHSTPRSHTVDTI